jgi:hypothetical protein
LHSSIEINPRGAATQDAQQGASETLLLLLLLP